jgi:hypothetical protein
MKFPSLRCAQAIRDGGIHAVAALDEALAQALVDVPENHRQDIKLAIGRAMSAVLDETVNPAVRAYAALDLDEQTWRDVAKARAACLAAS